MRIIAEAQPCTGRSARCALQDAQRAVKNLARMTDSCTTLLIVRHGETDWNKHQRLQGQSSADPPLNELGNRQAQTLACQLASETLDAVYSSDLCRAVQTAEAIASSRGLQVITSELLRERHLGQLQGLTYQEAPKLFPEAWRCLRSTSHTTRIPGNGESANDVVARAAAAVDMIASANPGKRVLLVAHGGVIHALYRHIQGRPYGDRIINGAMGIVKVDRGRYVIMSWNDASYVSSAGFMGQAFGGEEGGA